MKIGVLIDNEFAKGYPYPKRIEYMCKYLARDNDITVYCKKGEGLKLEEKQDGYKIKRVFSNYLGTSERVDLYLKSNIELFNLIEKNCEIYHCVDTMTLPIGIVLKNMFGGKVIFDTLEYFPDYICEEWYGENKKKYEMSKMLIRSRGAFINEADGVITTSELLAIKLKNEFNLEKKPTIAYNTSIDDNCRFKKNKEKKLREEFNIDNSKKIMLFQGLIEESRGIEENIKLVMNLEDMVLVLAGGISETYKLKLERLIADYKEQRKIYFTGFRQKENLQNYVLEADILIYTPHINVENINLTLPNKLFDFLISKKPIIVNEAMALKNIVIETKTGISIESGEHMEGKIEKIKKYLERYNPREIDYGYICKEYGLKKTLGNIVELYEKIMIGME